MIEHFVDLNLQEIPAGHKVSVCWERLHNSKQSLLLLATFCKPFFREVLAGC